MNFKYSCFFILLLFLKSEIKSQVIDSVVLQMVRNGLIENNQINKFEKLLENYNPKSPSNYIKALYQFEFENSFPNNKNFLIVIKPLDSNQLTINHLISDYLLKLKNSNLISERIFNFYINEVNQNQYIHYLQTLNFLNNSIEEESKFSKSNLYNFAKKLNELNIVQTQYEKLINEIELGKIETTSDLIQYFEGVLFSEKNIVIKDIQNSLKLLLKNEANRIIEPESYDLKIDAVIDSSKGSDKHLVFNTQLILKDLKIQNKKVSFYIPNTSDSEWDMIKNCAFYQILNQYLSKTQSNQRIHLFATSPIFKNIFIENEILALIPLSEKQSEFLYNSSYFYDGVNYTLSKEDFRNQMSKAEIISELNRLIEIRVITNCTEKEKGKYINDLNNSDTYSYSDILNYIPNKIYTLDTELGYEDSYSKILKNLSRISDNQFNPQKIEEKEKNNTTSVKFILNKQHFETTLNTESDWIDFRFFEFINTVIKKNNIQGEFYTLKSDSQLQSFIFLTKEQYNYLKSQKLMEFEEQ